MVQRFVAMTVKYECIGTESKIPTVMTSGNVVSTSRKIHKGKTKVVLKTTDRHHCYRRSENYLKKSLNK